MLVKISESPPALTKEDLDALSEGTPASFENIPPLLRKRQGPFKVTVEPECQGFSEFTGDLIITEAAVSVFNSESSDGFTIDYPSLTLHAVASTPENEPCLYFQVEQEYEEDLFELFLVPQGSTDAELIPSLFTEISECASLNPTPGSPAQAGGLGGMFGLDPDSMVYADANGNLAGPGVENGTNIPDDDDATGPERTNGTDHKSKPY